MHADYKMTAALPDKAARRNLACAALYQKGLHFAGLTVHPQQDGTRACVLGISLALPSVHE
jgi:hypothetical protein